MTAETQAFLLYSAAGVLGALAATALEERRLILPRLRDGALELGFVGTLVIALAAAHALDHTFSTALMAAIGGSATLRRLQGQIDRSFGRALQEMNEEQDSEREKGAG